MILHNDQSPLTVAQPVAIAIDSDRGILFWLDRGIGGSPPKVSFSYFENLANMWKKKDFNFSSLEQTWMEKMVWLLSPTI